MALGLRAQSADALSTGVIELGAQHGLAYKLKPSFIELRGQHRSAAARGGHIGVWQL